MGGQGGPPRAAFESRGRRLRKGRMEGVWVGTQGVSIMERFDNFQMSGGSKYYERVFRCPHNKSTAKMLYSFPKADRFGPHKKLLCDKIYNTPSTMQKRATSFGYGTKSDFTKNAEKSPSPDHYNFRDPLVIGKNNKVGYTFGMGREELRNAGALAIVRNNKNPGPGTYSFKSTLTKAGYTFGGSKLGGNTENRQVPGPGNYQTPFPFNSSGRYFLSKFKNSRAASFSADHQTRFRSKVTRTPGPGAYKLDLKAGGPEFVSKFKSCIAQTFPSSPRKTSISHQARTPGPGYYEMPTQFGSTEAGQNKQNQASTLSR